MSKFLQIKDHLLRKPPAFVKKALQGVCVRPSVMKYTKKNGRFQRPRWNVLGKRVACDPRLVLVTLELLDLAFWIPQSVTSVTTAQRTLTNH